MLHGAENSKEAADTPLMDTKSRHSVSPSRVGREELPSAPRGATAAAPMLSDVRPAKRRRIIGPVTETVPLQVRPHAVLCVVLLTGESLLAYLKCRTFRQHLFVLLGQQ